MMITKTRGSLQFLCVGAAILAGISSALADPPTPGLLQFCSSPACHRVQFDLPLHDCAFQSDLILLPNQAVSMRITGRAVGRYMYWGTYRDGDEGKTTQTSPWGTRIDRGPGANSDRGGNIPDLPTANILGRVTAQLESLSNVHQVSQWVPLENPTSLRLAVPATGTPSRLIFWIPSCGPTTFAEGQKYQVEATIMTVVPQPAAAQAAP